MVVSTGQDRTLDVSLALADAQTITAADGSTTGLQVGGSARVLDMGTGRTVGETVWDLGAVGAGAGIGSILLVQGSNSSTFASGVFTLAAMPVGDVTLGGESADDTGNGRYILAFDTLKKNTIYRYLRAAVFGRGTTQSCAISAVYVSKKQSN